MSTVEELGLSQALDQAKGRVMERLNTLRACQQPTPQVLPAPVVFDSADECRTAYLDALHRVTHDFYATTHLGSEFWWRDERVIVDENKELMARLGQQGGRSRRLVIVDRPVRQVIQRLLDDYVAAKKRTDSVAAEELRGRLLRMSESVRELIDAGSEVRVAYDQGQHLRRLARGRAEEIELAMYDDWRVDVFRAGQDGRLRHVECFTELTAGYQELRREVSDVLEALWQDSESADGLLHSIQSALEYADKRVNYSVAWLALYDHGLPESDRLLKLSELALVKIEVQRLGLWGSSDRLLDVGTCTARYPIELREAVHQDGEICGVDNDPDSVYYSRWKIARMFPEDTRMQIRRLDFQVDEIGELGPCDIITCMMGTMQHFERFAPGADGRYRDGLQQVLSRCAQLLTARGSFLFSVWLQTAAAKG